MYLDDPSSPEPLIRWDCCGTTARLKRKNARLNWQRNGERHICRACASSSPEAMAKRRQTNLERYGHENAMQDPTIQERNEQACLESLGTANPMQSEMVKDKVRETAWAKWGKGWPGGSAC